MARKKGDPEDFEIPVWTQLPVRWYRLLNRLARRHGIPRATLLIESLKHYGKVLEKKASPFRSVHVTEAEEEKAKQVFGKFSKNWWASLTPEQHEAEKSKRRNAAKARWARERGETQ